MTRFASGDGVSVTIGDVTIETKGDRMVVFQGVRFADAMQMSPVRAIRVGEELVRLAKWHQLQLAFDAQPADCPVER